MEDNMEDIQETKDYTINEHADIKIKLDNIGSNSGISDIAYIGRGYDVVNGYCFNVANLKNRVFTPYNNQVSFVAGKDDTVEFRTVFSQSEVAESLAATMKLNTGFGCFKAEAKSLFENNHSSTSNTAYTCASYLYLKGSETFDGASVRSLKEDGLLTSSFKADINDVNVPPSAIVRDYGTHVLVSGIVHGARLNFYLKTNHRTNIDKDKLELAIRGSFSKAFSTSGSLDTSGEFHEELEGTTFKFVQVGGDTGPDAMSLISGLENFRSICNNWKASLDKPNNANNIASVGHMLGLWEFADDEARRKELELYMTGQSSYTLDTKYHPIGYGFIKINEVGHLSNDHILNKTIEQLKNKFLEREDYRDHIKVIMPYFGDNAGKLGVDFTEGSGYQEYVDSIYRYRLLFNDIFMYMVIGDQNIPSNFDISFNSYQATATPLEGIECDVRLDNYSLPEPAPYNPPRPPHGGML